MSKNTLGDEKLKDFELNQTDKNIIDLWESILEEARKTRNYNLCRDVALQHLYSAKNEQKTYGLYQIIQELNTYIYNGKSYKKDELKSLNLNTNDKKLMIYEYVELNTKIDDLKKILKEYYKKFIHDKLFLYELLK